MGSFNTPTVVYSAERPYTKLATFAKFTALLTAFKADTTMNLKSNEYSAISLKGVKNVIAPEGQYEIEAGEVGATASVIISPKKDDGIPGIALTAYPAMMEQLKTSWAESYWTDGATVVEDTDKQAWSAKFHIETASGDDCYFQIGNEKAVLSSYNLTATLATINTWCNTQPDMDNDITA